MEIETIIISAFVTIFSLGLLTISITSYRKYKNQKLLFVSIVFLVFLLKGILLSLGLYQEDIAALLTSSYAGIFDLIILILLFMVTLKR